MTQSNTYISIVYRIVFRRSSVCCLRMNFFTRTMRHRHDDGDVNISKKELKHARPDIHRVKTDDGTGHTVESNIEVDLQLFAARRIHRHLVIRLHVEVK